jgi:ABC-2 type transport system permease protein
MIAARIFRTHVWIDTIELIRLPMYSVSTVVFPTLLFLLFGLPYAHSTEAARMIMSSYAAYAVIGVTLFQFGVGIAADRDSPWEQFLRTLPVGVATRLAAQIAAALFFAFGSVSVVVIAGSAFGHARTDLALLARLVPTLLAGSIPFALLGITIGYWAGRRSALPIANLIYLPVALGGGLWMPPAALPKAIAAVSPLLPSRHYGEAVWAAAAGDPAPLASWVWLLGYAILFGATAIWGYRRDEGRNYR